jgi:TPR repeat protein
MLKMPISSRWRSISVVLPLLLSAGALSAPAPVLARAPETAAVLETMDSGTVSRAAVEALLARAGTGDAEAAEVAGRLYDRGIGVKWDPPTALRWYAVAALAGRDSAKREAGRLWRVMPPVSQRRAEAVLARFFTDAELAGINLGPVRRPTTQRSWMTNLEAGGFLTPPPPAPVATPAPVLVPPPAAVPAAALVPVPVPVPVPAAVPKPLAPQLVAAAIAAPPAPQSAVPAPATALAAAAAFEAVVPPPPRKPGRKNAGKVPTILPVSHTPVPRTPVPPAKPKR